MSCRYFLPFCRLPLHFVDCFICCREGFLFDVVPLVDSAFFVWAVGVIFKKSLPESISRSLYSMFSSRRFTSFSSVHFSHSVVSNSLWPHGLQHARVPYPSPAPGACSNSGPSSWWCHQTSHPLLSPSLPAFNLFQHQTLFQWVSSSHQVVKVLEFHLQHQSFQWMFRTNFL